MSLPVFAQGGIGLYTAAACYAAGAAGCVLEIQLSLTRESPLSEQVKESLSQLDGSETIRIQGTLGSYYYRAYFRPGLEVIEELRMKAEALADSAGAENGVPADWRQWVKNRVGPGLSPARHLANRAGCGFCSWISEAFSHRGGSINRHLGSG